MLKKFALAFAVCIILAAPFLWTASPSTNALAGRKILGDGKTIYCSPCCDKGDCLCDPGESPECSFGLMAEEPATGATYSKPAQPDFSMLILLALAFGTLGWRWR